MASRVYSARCAVCENWYEVASFDAEEYLSQRKVERLMRREGWGFSVVIGWACPPCFSNRQFPKEKRTVLSKKRIGEYEDVWDWSEDNPEEARELVTSILKDQPDGAMKEEALFKEMERRFVIWVMDGLVEQGIAKKDEEGRYSLTEMGELSAEMEETIEEQPEEERKPPRPLTRRERRRKNR